MRFKDLLNRDSAVTWLFAGDSITQGAIYTHGNRDYTQLFKERLFEAGRRFDVVINTAISGWTLGDFLPCIDDRVLRFKPDAVFVLFGTNDSVVGLDGLKTFADRYTQAIEQIRAGGMGRVCLQTSPPMHPIDPELFVRMGQYADEVSRDAARGRLRNVLGFLDQYVQTTRDVAKQHDLPLIDHHTDWLATKGSRGQLLDGGFHPNAFGHRLMARTLLKSLGLWDEKSRTCRLDIPE